MKYCSETTEIPELTMDEQVSNLVSSLLTESESEGKKDLSSASDLHDSSEITVQVSEEPRSNADDSYLTNLKMKALGWLKSLQRSTVEIEHNKDDNDTKPERLSWESDVPQSRFEKQEEQLEEYEKHRDTPVPFYEETTYQVDIIEQSISSEISVPDHSDHSPKTQDTQIIQDEENISVEFRSIYEVEGQITQEQTTQEQTTEEKTDEIVPMLPDQNTIDESIDVSQTPIEENGLTMENMAVTAAVAYHFGITNSDVQVAEQEPLQKTPPVKKKKKVDKVEVMEKTEKQKPTKDESSENLVIKKKKKKKKTIQDPVKQEPENTVPRPPVVKKKHKKDYEDKVYHDVVPSVSMESKLSIIKNSRQEFRDKSPSKLKEYNSPSSQTSMGSLHSFNSMKQYHSHMSRSPLNRSPMNRSPMNRSPLNRSPQNRSPTNYSGLSPRMIINNGYHTGYKTRIKPVRRLSAEPTDQFPVWSNIPLAVPGSSPIRPPVKVAMCHRRLREDYMLNEKPSKLPLTKSFCATLDSAVVSEWAMHSWCQNTPATLSDAHRQPMWRYAKGDHLVEKTLPDHDMKIEQYYISRIFFLIMAVIALGFSQFIYSFHKTEDIQYKYECTEGDEICELKDDLSLYL